MEDLPLKIKKRIVIGYLENEPVENLSQELKLSTTKIEEIINEWKNGYLSIYNNDYEIADEIKEIAKMMKEKEITIPDLIQGYLYSQIFSMKDKDRIIKIVKSLDSMDDKTREEFLKTAEKMMKFSKYMNVEYVDIPDTLEKMVEKGKALNKDIKEMELKIQTLKNEVENLNNMFEKKLTEINKMTEELEFAKNLQKFLSEKGIDKKKLIEFIESVQSLNYSLNNWDEINKALKMLKEKDLTPESFVKISDYLVKLLNLGLTVSMIKNLEIDLENESINVKDYLDEMDEYLKNKISYKKSIEELKKEEKELESQIRSIRSEIKEYFKKIKPKMQ